MRNSLKRHGNVETCRSIDYIKRHFCDIYFSGINYGFVGYNKIIGDARYMY